MNAKVLENDFLDAIDGQSNLKVVSEKLNISYTAVLSRVKRLKGKGVLSIIDGKYKVLDILHSDKVVWFETYLDELCKVNHCQRGQLRYDLGYLASCHAFASNMQELSDLMRYLDKTYCIGKPRVTLMNLGEESPSGILIKPTEGMLLSDDMAMDFGEFGRPFGEYDGKRIIATYQRVYDRLMGIRFNMLHMLCLGHIMRDPIMKISIAESIFDDAKICELMKNATEIPGHIW